MRGTKRFEYRSRPTAIRERIYAYANLKSSPAEEFKRMGIQPGDLALGVIVGTVEITDCTGKPREYKSHLARPRRLNRPMRPKKHPQPGVVQSVLAFIHQAKSIPLS